MVRLNPKLERRLDNYAILYCFHRDGRYVNQKASEFVRRIHGLGRRKRYASLLYYRQQKICCKAVKKGLEGFAKSYVGMNQMERAKHDEEALVFITGVFSQEVDNVFYLIDYYNQKKSEVLG